MEPRHCTTDIFFRILIVKVKAIEQLGRSIPIYVNSKPN